MPSWNRVCTLWTCALLGIALPSRSAVVASVQGSAAAGTRLELALSGLPTASNRFDPDVIRVDVALVSPSGKGITVPAFWYQAFLRSLNGASEVLTTSGSPGWRARFWPAESGDHTLTVRLATNGVDAGVVLQTTVPVAAATAASRVGPVRLSASANGFLEAGDGSPLPLVGANVCWPQAGGTFDYDTWFQQIAANGGNFARIWMCPWAFGIEAEGSTLTRYRLDRAWQLDRILQVAEQRGIYLMLCLDYHGMFATLPDSTFGGNDNWKLNPYNTANGGPCASPNAFFTSSTARLIYQKRLRYLIGRYGQSPQVLAWELMNEIDNMYNPQNGALNAGDVAAWHAAIGTWLKANDPFHHLVTTSLTGSSDRPEIWSIPSMDFSQFHAYGLTTPASALPAIATRMRKAYGKPALIGEFGVDFRGWMRTTEDPYLRGFRQALWGAALGGSGGTAMSWWWENLASENVYVLHHALRSITSHTRWGEGAWTPIGFVPASPRPTTVGDLAPGGATFTTTLVPGQNWGELPGGQLALVDSSSADYAGSTLNSFLQGTTHPDLRSPFKLSAWFDSGARVVVHVNSVSVGARLGVFVDGVSVLSTNLPDKDGKFDAQVNEYNVDIPAPVSAGKHLVELRNTGGDWLFLDWVRVERIRTATYPGNWVPALNAGGLRGDSESLVYVVSPSVNWPAGATNAAPPLLSNRSVVATNWPAGRFGIRWYLTTNAAPVGDTIADSVQGRLQLDLPPFNEDLVGIVVRQPALQPPRVSPTGTLHSGVLADPGSRWELQQSSDLSRWNPVSPVTNLPAPVEVDLGPPAPGAHFFRLARPTP